MSKKRKTQVVTVENGAVTLRLQIGNAAGLCRLLEAVYWGQEMPTDDEVLNQLELWIGLLRGGVIAAAQQVYGNYYKDKADIEAALRDLGIET